MVNKYNIFTLFIFLHCIKAVALYYNCSEFESLTFDKKQNNEYRRPYLLQNKEAVFWHLKHPSIGMQKKFTTDQQPLSWSFELWELAPQKGKNIRIVIIDQLFDSKVFSKNFFCEICKKRHNAQAFFSDELRVGKAEKKSMSEACKNEFFLQLLKNISLSHGTGSTFVIQQLAPNAQIDLYDMFDEQGYGASTDLCRLLCKISNDITVDIVHLGCKLVDKRLSTHDEKLLQQTLKKIKYSVAASGNDVVDQQVAYPARCQDVSFDVGAFYHDVICSFSQFELGIGPKIVAPGQHIFFPISYKNQIVGYGAQSGTSVAAALVTGFLALVLSEFQSDFSYKEIVSVIYASAQKLKAHNSDWDQKVLLGAIDMRTALFCLHILKEIKKRVSKKRFDSYFNRYLETALVLNDLYQKEGLLSSCVQHVANLVLEVFKTRIKSVSFENSFDKRLIYLLRTTKKKNRKSKFYQMSQRIQYALNREGCF